MILMIAIVIRNPGEKFRIEIHSEPIRNFPIHSGIFYPHQTVSFRSNPKKFFNPNLSKAHSKSIRMNPVNPNLSDLIQIYNRNEFHQSE